MGKLIPFLFIALDGKSAVAHLRLRIPGHKLRGSWFSFRWSPVRIVIGSHGLIATVFYFKNYATGIQRQHGMPGSCGHLQHRTGFPNTLRLPNTPQVTLRISVGVAPLNPQMSHYREWLKSADLALYKAKKAGRNRTEVAA